MRDRKIDIMKGLTIVLMVLGHSGFPYTKFIYLFHMAVFFMISGYLFNINREDGIYGIGKYVLKKIKNIWLPYFLWNAIFTIANNVLIKLNIYSNETINILGNDIADHKYMSIKDMFMNIIKGIFMVGRTELGGAFWFLRTLFALSILFVIINYILNCLIKNNLIQDIIHLCISILFLCIGYATNIMGVTSISIPVVLSCYILYYLGYVIKKYNYMKYVKNWVAIIIGMLVLVLCYQGPGISMGDNNYVNPLYMLVCSLAGWMVMYGQSDILAKWSFTHLIEITGRYTLTIVIHHFWCFKFVHLLQIGIYRYPMDYLAAFPYLNANGWWWIAFCLSGVIIPVLLQQGYNVFTGVLKINRK